MEKRITKKENFGMLKEIAEKMGRTDLVEFIDHERKANQVFAFYFVLF